MRHQELGLALGQLGLALGRLGLALGRQRLALVGRIAGIEGLVSQVVERIVWNALQGAEYVRCTD